MALQTLVIDTATGQISGSTSSGGSSSVPTLIAAAATFAVAANTQALFHRKIELSAGARITVGSNGVLCGV